MLQEFARPNYSEVPSLKPYNLCYVTSNQNSPRNFEKRSTIKLWEMSYSYSSNFIFPGGISNIPVNDSMKTKYLKYLVETYFEQIDTGKRAIFFMLKQIISN